MKAVYYNTSGSLYLMEKSFWLEVDLIYERNFYPQKLKRISHCKLLVL